MKEREKEGNERGDSDHRRRRIRLQCHRLARGNVYGPNCNQIKTSSVG